MTVANLECDAEPSITDRVLDAVEEIRTKVERTKGKLGELGKIARDKLNDNRDVAANGVERVAGCLRNRADHRSADRQSMDDKLFQVAYIAANKLNATAGYMRRNDVESMIHDVEGWLRKNPGALMLMALGLGFVVGRKVNRHLCT